MLFPALFKALRGTAEWIQDEDRHPHTARLSRRTFARLAGAFILLESAHPSTAYGAAFGECSGCGSSGACPEGCGVVTDACPCGGPVPCVGSNCWCAGSVDAMNLYCDCKCDNELCICTDSSAGNPCRGSGGGKHPGELF